MKSPAVRLDGSPNSPTTRSRLGRLAARRLGLDGEARACHSRRVKSCGPSGSQDLAFLRGVSRADLAARVTYTRDQMAVPVREVPAPSTGPASPLDEVLRRVNRIRTAHGADPLYELPLASTAWDGGGCVLERAFEDLDVLVVDYRRAYGRHIEFEHGLDDFVRDFDGGRYPGLFARR